MNDDRHKTGTWLLLLVLAAASAGACSGDDDDSPPGVAGSGAPGVAGSGGKAEGGTGGVGGNAQGGESEANAGAGRVASCSDGGDCETADYCAPLPLADLCDPSPMACPSFDELAPTGICRRADRVTLQETSCGGQVVVADYDWGTDTWGFDANGALTYKRTSTDQFVPCPDGKTASSGAVYGEQACTLTGTKTDLCGAGSGGAGGAGGGGGAP
jgi:hypothetical protein